MDWDNFPSGNLSTTKNTVTQEYDALNRIRKALYPTDNASQRKEMEPTYNKGGALKAVKVDGTNYVEEIAYNARGQRLLLAMGNGMMTRYAYDPETFRVARTKSEKFTYSGLTYTPDGGVQQDLAYTYDLEGTILSQNDDAPANTSAQGPGGQLREFIHDPLRRLISATGRESSNAYQQPSWDLNLRPQDYTATNTYTRAYSYDKIGNIQTLNHVAAGHANQNFNRAYNYGTSFADNRLESFELTSNTYFYQYDSAGNIIQEGANRYYEWTQNDKPATYSNQAGTSDPTVYTNYFYNAAGERVKKHIRKGKQVEVTFYMDGGMFETSYVKPTGGSIDNNRFYNTLHVLDITSRIATIRVGNDTDDPTSPIKYYLEDHTSTSLSAGLMDSLVVLETDGTLINREEFYPFGETSFGGFAKKRYRFNGKEKDEESGLYYYGQRYYAPWLCRFISVDPIAESYPQLSSYNYAGNKPVSFPDIDGLQSPAEEPGPVGESKASSSKTESVESFQGINFYQSAMTNNLLPDGFTKSGTHFNAGPYTMIPQYQKVDGKDVPAYYLAADRETGLPEYAVGIEDSGHFIRNAEAYDLKHSLTSRGGDLGFKYAEAVELAFAGEYGAAWSMYKETLKEDWSRSLSDPEYIATTLLALAHAGVALRAQTSTTLARNLRNVDERTIQSALEGSTMKTVQAEVSLPVVQRYVRKLDEGSSAPPIKVEGDVIIEGNHRYVAGRVYGVEPEIVPGTLSPSQRSRIVPMQKTKVNPIDFGNN